MPEIWDIYNKNHTLTGKTHRRGVPVTTVGEYHLVVEIITENIKGELLITQRHPNKSTFPLKWEFTGGAVVSGEDSRTGALRELCEETGITAAADELELLGSYIGSTAIHDIYRLLRDAELPQLSLQPD